MPTDEKKKKSTLVDTVLGYLRGQSQATEFDKLKPNPTPQMDEEEAKKFRNSFNSVK